MGKWSLTWILLSSLGYPVLSIVADFPGAYFHEVAMEEQRRFGMRYALVGRGASKLVDQALAGNEIVTCCCDVPFRQEKLVKARFGGAELMVDPGTAKLMMRYSSPILRFTVRTNAEGCDVVRLGPFVSRPSESDPEAATQNLTQELIDGIYQDIQARPAEWYGWSFVETQGGR